MGDDVRQRSLAQAWRPKEQHVVQRLFPLFGRADEDLQLLPHLGLADIIVEQFGAQSALNGLLCT